MKTSFLFLALILTGSFILTSCSTNEAERNIEIARFVEYRSTQDLLNDLYLASENDLESLARMLEVTPSSIERIRNGKTMPTKMFEEKVKKTYLYYMQNDKSYIKLRSTLDHEFSWYDDIVNFNTLHPISFWIIMILFVLICIIIGCAFWVANPMYSLAFMATVICICVLLPVILTAIAWLFGWLFEPGAMEDKYIETINPVIEVLI